MKCIKCGKELQYSIGADIVKDLCTECYHNVRKHFFRIWVSNMNMMINTRVKKK